jgi:hypothetical protein
MHVNMCPAKHFYCASVHLMRIFFLKQAPGHKVNKPAIERAILVLDIEFLGLGLHAARGRVGKGQMPREVVHGGRAREGRETRALNSDSKTLTLNSVWWVSQHGQRPMRYQSDTSLSHSSRCTLKCAAL